MIEAFDNAFQLVILAICVVLSATRLFQTRSDEWLMSSGFYGCSLLALTYWTAYLLVFGETPRYFYVSETGWVASRVFLLMLVAALDERRRPCAPVPMAWAAVAVMAPLFALYVTHGDVLLNVVDCSIMTAIGFYTVRGMAAAPLEGPEGDCRLHVAVLVWWLAQLAVWTTSCFQTPEAYASYIASDLALSVTYLLLALEMRRALP